MTSVPNLRLQLNGNNQLWLILIVFLVASCDLFKPVQTDSPRSTDQDDELDEVQGRRVYDPETGTYIVIENAPTEKMDTIRWRNVPVDPEQIIRSSEESFIVDEPGAGPARELGSEIIAPNVETKFLSSYNVTMMLPFLSDRFSPASEKLPANSDWALHFYSGAKMALEDLESEDISMTVSVIDGRETSMSAVQQLLRTNEDLQKAQLIIGPYRSETARLVADFAKRNNSVVFSPYTTSTEITSNNPNYVQVNPSLRSHCEAITRHARQRFNPEQIVLAQTIHQFTIRGFQLEGAGSDQEQLLAQIERPVLVAVAAGAARPDLAEVQDHKAAQFADWQLPDDLLWIEALPLTATGKVSKLTLRAQFEDYVHPDLREGRA